MSPELKALHLKHLASVEARLRECLDTYRNTAVQVLTCLADLRALGESQPHSVCSQFAMAHIESMYMLEAALPAVISDARKGLEKEQGMLARDGDT